MSDISKTERQLKGTDGETPDLRGVIGDRDPEDVDLFGFQVIYTTGDFTLPREALLDKMAEVGLPDWMAPNAVAPHRAFTRMVADIADDGEEIDFGGHRVRFEIEPGENQRYTKHFHAKVFHSADDGDVNATEGKWIDHELGVLRYDSDSNGINFVDRIDEDRALAPLWYDGIKQRARKRFDFHQSHHNGDDVNNMVYYLARQWTDAVKLRDSCYFIPATYEGIEEYIDGFRALYEWINTEYKQRGQTTELFAIEIVDSERQREMVEDKVRGEITGEIDQVFEGVIDEVRDGEAAEQVAEEVVDSLDEVQGLAERHSATLKTELSVKRAMRRVLDEMAEDREEIVSEVLDKTGLDLDDAPEVTA